MKDYIERMYKYLYDKDMRIKTSEELEGVDFYGLINSHYSYYYAWKNLQSKSEADSEKSEKGYQMIAKQMAGRVARTLGYDADKAEVLSMAIGSCFPRNGRAGMDYIKKYITRRGLDIDTSTLAIDCIEESVGSVFKYISEDMDNSVRAYFSDDQSIPEVNIVRVCQRTVEDIKRVERYNPNIAGGDLLFSVSEDIITDSKLSGKIRESARLRELTSKLPRESQELSEEEKQIMSEQLDSYVQSFGEKGIFKYIYSNGR